MVRSRDEAKAVSRKLQTTSSTRFMPSGPGASGLGGLGLMGSILDVPVAGLSGSSSTPSLPSCTGSLSQPAGYMGQGLGSSSSSQVVGFGFRDSNGFDQNSSMGFRRQPASMNAGGNPPAQNWPPMANRRALQAQATAQMNRARAPRDLTQCVALGAGLAPPPRFPEALNYQSGWGTSPSPGLNSMDRGPMQPPVATASSSDAPGQRLSRRAARGGDAPVYTSDNGNDQELANLFWNQENSRGGDR